MSGVNADSAFAGLKMFIHGTKHAVNSSRYLKPENVGNLMLVVPDPKNQWDKNTFDIFSLRSSSSGAVEKMTRVGCVQRNLAQLLSRLTQDSLVGRLVLSKNSYSVDVFEVEILGELVDRKRLRASLQKVPKVAVKSAGFFDETPSNDNAIDSEDY